MTEVKENSKLHVALVTLIKTDEHYTDYLCTTTYVKKPANTSDDIEKDIYAKNHAIEAF
jgi:hypothetical protein